MKIQIASDLHLEFDSNRDWIKKNPIIPKGDVLILAGDIIMNSRKKKARPFYNIIDSEFNNIISIFGNHEFYRGQVMFSLPSYKGKFSDRHVRLNNKSIIIDNVKFICSTLWTQIPKDYELIIEDKMNDYIHIFTNNKFDKLTIDLVNKFNKVSLRYIKEELEKDFKGKIVVITHHAPCKSLIETNNLNSSILDYAYYNDLDEFIKKIQRLIYGSLITLINSLTRLLAKLELSQTL